jgi:hypothetical protein
MGRESFTLSREQKMKPKLSKIPKDLRAQRESIHRWRFAKQSTPLDLTRLAKETLPNATPLTPEERASINEFFWSHFK